MKARTLFIGLGLILFVTACQQIPLSSAQADSRGTTVSNGVASPNGDYSQSVSIGDSAATFTFQSNVNSGWVDVHFATTKNPCLQNFRLNRTENIWSITVPVVLDLGPQNSLNYFFTYEKQGLAYDTPQFVVYPSPSPRPTPTPSPTPEPNPTPVPPTVVDNFNSALRWALKSNSLGKPITTQGGLFNLEADQDLYMFYNEGSYHADGFTESIGLDLSSYSSLVIIVKGELGGEQLGLTVVLNDGSDHAVPLGNYGLISNSYSSIRIPLSAFSVQKSAIQYLRIEGRGFVQAVRFDEIRFE